MVKTIWGLAREFGEKHESETLLELEITQLTNFCASIVNNENCPYDLKTLIQGFALLEKQEEEYLKELEKTPDIQFGLKVDKK